MTGGDCFCLKGRKKSHLVCPSHEQHGVSLLCRNDANAATNQKTRPKQGRSVCHRDRTCGCSCPVGTGHHRALTDPVTGRVAEVGGSQQGRFGATLGRVALIPGAGALGSPKPGRRVAVFTSSISPVRGTEDRTATDGHRAPTGLQPTRHSVFALADFRFGS